MLYQISLTIPANTLVNEPVQTTIEIKEDYLWKIGIHFPSGCVGMVKIAIYYGRKQIWPSEKGEWVAGDDVTIWDEPYIRLPDKPTKLICKGVSTGTSYDHTIRFYFHALPRKYVVWPLAIDRLLNAIKKLVKFITGV